tara:strand:+ start:851 stop:994 length:144 start_codon:yes stop_codon:yes gene_type:complete
MEHVKNVQQANIDKKGIIRMKAIPSVHNVQQEWNSVILEMTFIIRNK